MPEGVLSSLLPREYLRFSAKDSRPQWWNTITDEGECCNNTFTLSDKK